MILTFIITVPVLLFHQLRKHAYLPKHVSRRTRVVYGFLFFGFEREYYYWEVRQQRIPASKHDVITDDHHDPQGFLSCDRSVHVWAHPTHLRESGFNSVSHCAHGGPTVR
jgi:hypothetical protein